MRGDLVQATAAKRPRVRRAALAAIAFLSMSVLVAPAAVPNLSTINAAPLTGGDQLAGAALEPEAGSQPATRVDISGDDRISLVREERTALAEAGARTIDELAERTQCGGTDDGTEAVLLSTPELSSGVVTTACPICVKGIPCGNTCISARYTCHTLGGCASFGGSGPAPVVSTPEYLRIPEFSISSQSAYPRLEIGQSVELTLRVTVLHGPSWFDRDVGLYVSNPAEAGLGLRGWDATGLLAYNAGVSFIGPTQDFRLRIQALAAGTYRLRVAFKHKTFGTVGPDGVYWDVTVNPAVSGTRLYEGWHSRWVTQSAYPIMSPGQVLDFWIRFTNTGTESWTRGVWGRQVNLALNGDNKEPFRLGMASNWLWDDRLATTTTSVVAPGEVAEFRFQVRAPLRPGVYSLNLRPVVDGTTWLEDEGVYWTIVVR